MDDRPIKPHGLLLLRKPEGITSHDVVEKVRRLLQSREVGHCGTLDPAAEGLLVLAVGEATKVAGLVTEGDKTYEGTIRLGIKTDTGDRTGAVLTEAPVPQGWSIKWNWEKVAKDLSGAMSLAVPKFSAVKVGGERLYKKARAGEEFEAPRRNMVFSGVHLEPLEEQNLISFRLRATKGSYVRSWVDQLGDVMGIPTTLETLRRTRSEPYDLSQALTLDRLESLGFSALISQNLPGWVPLCEVLPQWEKIWVDGYDLHLLRGGQISKNLKNKLIRSYKPHGEGERGFKAVAQGDRGGGAKLVALIGVAPGEGFFIKRGFRYD